MTDELLAGSSGSVAPSCSDWEQALFDSISLVPKEILATELMDIVRNIRASQVGVNLFCEQCGDAMPVSLRQRNHARVCRSCKKADRERRIEEDRVARAGRIHERFHGGYGSARFRFDYMCSYLDPDGAYESLRALKYSDFLTSRYWKIVRKYVGHRSGWSCVMCNSKRDLDVHHKTYEHHGMEHRHLEDLVVVCRKCHAKFHDKFADYEKDEKVLP